MPRDATTGMYPSALSRITKSGFTASTSPTCPRSTSPRRLRATSMRPSLPLMPTARPPAWRIAATSALLARPPSTISTTSIVSGSVTRSPPTNADVLPIRSSTRVISGPPPCTSTGCTPASFSSVRSCASVPPCVPSSTLPPNLTTAILPFHAPTYRSPWAMTPPCSTAAGLGDVSGIFLDVPLGEITGPHRRLAFAEGEVDGDLHLVAVEVAHDLVERLPAARAGPALGDQHGADAHRRPLRLHLRPGIPDRGQHAPPVRRPPVHRGLHERREGHRHRRPMRVLVALRAAHHHLDQLRRALAVARDHLRQRDAQRREPALERLERLARPRDLGHAGVAVREQEHGVVRAAVAVDREPVIRRVGRPPQRRLQHGRHHRGVGGKHRERGGHLRVDHGGALRHAAERHDLPADLDLHGGALRRGVRRHDR